MSSFQNNKIVELYDYSIEVDKNSPPHNGFLEANDFLMISEQTNQTIFTSKKVNVSSLYAEINEYFTTISSITFNTGIIFKSDLSVTSEMIEKEIKLNNNKTAGCQQVINFEYAKKEFLNPLDELSSKIYDDIQMPSYIGQIIYTTTLRTLQSVKKYYGKQTEWKQIRGRFILGVNTKNNYLNTANIRGGEVYHTLTIDEIPEHIHKFTPSSEKKELNGHASLTSDASGEPIGVDSGYKIKGEDDHNAKFWTLGCVVRQNCPDGTISEEYMSMFGNNGPDAIINPNPKSRNIKHSNMPPYVAMFIWERIA